MSTGYKLKKGDQVVMHTCMEHDHPDNFGRIWVCRSNEFQHKGHDYGSVMLEGFSGSFSTEFLQKVNVEQSRKITFPRQDDGEGGWVIDYKFLEQLGVTMLRESNHTIDTEDIELVLLTLEIVLGQEGEGNQDATSEA